MLLWLESVGETQKLAEQVGTLQRIALAARATLHLRVQIALAAVQRNLRRSAQRS